MVKIHIHNVRLGLAANSSSSHSFIILTGQKQDKRHTDTTIEGEFGGDNFTLDTHADKTAYLAVALRDNLDAITSPYVRDLILNDLFAVESVEGYIDHQSQFFLPSDYHHPNLLDNTFVQAFQKWVLSEDVVILGGNDNSSPHPLRTERAVDMSELLNSSNNVVRYDADYKYWSLFNRQTGAKIRFSFEELGRSTPIITKSAAPELVDLKITDNCPFGCAFCYQSSTTQGAHANIDVINNQLKVLSEMKVFEVAIGGGEPTLHPQFISILRYARELGIVPNFTTRNLAWLRDPAAAQSILQYAGAFAFSAQTAQELDTLFALCLLNNIEKHRCHIHLVMGTMEQREFRSMLRKIKHHGFPVTLLGYKTTGFGKNISPLPYDWWINTVKEEMKQTFIHIDTVLAKQFEPALIKAGIPQWMYHTQDGTFSAYIDAVKNEIGPSSYEETRVAVPKHFTVDWFKEIYAQWK